MENATAAKTPVENATKLHKGSCHCGAVTYEVTADATSAGRCNCSVCMKINGLGKLVKPHEFKLLGGESELSSYEWGARFSKRFFCKHCGVHVFGKGHLDVLGGDFVSVNLQTLDDADPSLASVIHWDGRHDNWQAGPRSTPWPLDAAKAS